MKTLIASILLLFATTCFSAVPAYTKFKGIGGILVTTNPPDGDVTIDGTGIGGTNTGLNAAQVTNVVNALVNTNVSYTSNYFTTNIVTIVLYTSNFFNTLNSINVINSQFTSNFFNTFITSINSFTSNYFNNVNTTIFNTIYEVGANDTNYVNIAASNRVTVAPGPNIFVSTQGINGVTIYQVGTLGSAGTNFPPVVRIGTNIALAQSGRRQSFTLQTNASFNILFNGTPLNGENVVLGVANTSANVIYMTPLAYLNTNGFFDPTVGSNRTTFAIPALSIKVFEFVAHTNFTAGLARWELRDFLGKEVELGAAGGLVMHTNPENSIITISNRTAGLQEASPLGSVQWNSNNVQVGATDFTYTNGFVDIGNGPAIPAKPGTLRASNVWNQSDVRFWGAIPDDGLDDTAAIQTCVNFNQAGGKTYVPKGVFFLTTNISLPNYSVFGGEGTLLGTNGITMLTATNVGGSYSISISGIIFDGGGSARAVEAGVPEVNVGGARLRVKDVLGYNLKSGIKLNGMYYSSIENCTFVGLSNLIGAGMWATNTGEIGVYDSTFGNFSTAVLLTKATVHFNKSYFYADSALQTNANYLVHVMDDFDAVFNSCVFEDDAIHATTNLFIEGSAAPNDWRAVRNLFTGCRFIGNNSQQRFVVLGTSSGTAVVNTRFKSCAFAQVGNVNADITFVNSTATSIQDCVRSTGQAGIETTMVTTSGSDDGLNTFRGQVSIIGTDTGIFSVNTNQLVVNEGKTFIGTTNGSAKLNIGGLGLTALGGGDNVFQFRSDMGIGTFNNWAILLRRIQEDDFSLYNVRQGTTPIYINNLNYVGFSTNAPASTFDLMGTMRTHGLPTNASPISLLGRLSTGEIVETATVSGGGNVSSNNAGGITAIGLSTNRNKLYVEGELHGASLFSSGFVGDFALISDPTKQVVESSVTTTELATLSGIGSTPIITQLSNKVKVVAGANITVTPSGSGGVMTYTVAGSASAVAAPINSVQFNSNGTQQGSAKLVFTNGNLGVGGGRLPTANLSVYRGLAGTAMDLTGSADQTVNDLRVDFNLTNNVDAVGTYARLGIQAGDATAGEEYGHFYISTVNSGVLTEHMRITPDGALIQTNFGNSVAMINGSIAVTGIGSYIATNTAPSRKVAPANLHNIAIGSGWTNDMGARADLVIVLSQSDAATGDPGIMVTNVTDVSGITKLLTGGLVQTHQEPIYLLDVNPNDVGSIIDLSTGTGSAQSIKFAYWKLK